jgi:hypothetical protein
MSGSCTGTHSYTAPGSYIATVTLTDDDLGSVTNSSLQINVKAPVSISALSASPGTINENGQTTLNGVVPDPVISPHTVTINWGDGSSNTNITLAAGVFSFSAGHLYRDD